MAGFVWDLHAAYCMQCLIKYETFNYSEWLLSFLQDPYSCGNLIREDLKNDAWEWKWWNTLHEKPCYLNKGTAVLLKEMSEFWSKIKASPLKRMTCFWTKIQQMVLVTLTGFSMDLFFFRIKTDLLVKPSGMWSLCLIKIIIHLKVSYKATSLYYLS